MRPAAPCGHPFPTVAYPAVAGGVVSLAGSAGGALFRIRMSSQAGHGGIGNVGSLKWYLAPEGWILGGITMYESRPRTSIPGQGRLVPGRMSAPSGHS
jgi:hypothetical protein